MVTRAEFLADAIKLYSQHDAENAAQEVPWILNYVLGNNVTTFVTDQGKELTEEQFQQADSLIKKRIAGEPLQYLLGHTEFYGLEFQVGPGVLIPRPETERLVDFTLERVTGPQITICDLCTGSGAIAVALASNLKDSRVVAVDISPDALRYAERNIALNKVSVDLRQGDLFSFIDENEMFDIVVSNPPYVSEKEYEIVPDVVKDFEPELALVADNEGLEILDRIADQARSYLKKGGWLLCEMGEEQGAKASEIWSNYGYTEVEVKQDYTGRDRIVIGRWMK